MEQVDANQDGQLSKDEFNSFLTSLLQGVTNTTSPTTTSKAVVTP
ncbi:MAG: EF-hand domain-containing protein [Vicinamibacterales bacterium]